MEQVMEMNIRDYTLKKTEVFKDESWEGLKYSLQCLVFLQYEEILFHHSFYIYLILFYSNFKYNLKNKFIIKIN
jgi:hypothetical protein